MTQRKVKCKEEGRRRIYNKSNSAFLLAPEHCTSKVFPALPLSEDNDADRAISCKSKQGPQPTSDNVCAEGIETTYSNKTTPVLLNENFTERRTEEGNPLLEVPMAREAVMVNSNIIDVNVTSANRTASVDNVLTPSAQQHNSTAPFKYKNCSQSSKIVKLEDKTDNIDVNKRLATNEERCPTDR